VIVLRRTVEIKLAIEIEDEVISRDDLLKEDEKCGGCNWHSGNLYLMASSEEEAKKLYKEYERGLCGFCFTKMLYEEGFKINK